MRLSCLWALPQHHDRDIIPVQFLRGVAAALVVVVHLIERLVKRGAYPGPAEAAPWSVGELGVSTFFAISGFIILHTSFEKFGSPKATRAFMRGRILRIAPLYYLTTLLMIGFSFLTFSASTNVAYVAPNLSDIMCSFLFVPKVDHHGLIMPVYQLGWTLQYEMFFYLLFAFALLASMRWGLIFVLSILTACVGVGWLAPAPAFPSADFNITRSFLTNRILVYFAIGMALALVRREFGPVRTSWPPPLCCAAASASLVIAAFVPALPQIIAVTVAITLAVMLETERKSESFSRFARMLGNSSYAVYLTHSFLLGAIAAAAARYLPVTLFSLVGLMLLTVAVCCAFAWHVWRFIEVPIANAFRGRAISRANSKSVAP